MKSFPSLFIWFALTFLISPGRSSGQASNGAEDKPRGERHEFVKRGNHVKEMALGTYVIVGVFQTEVNARQMSDELQKSNPEAGCGYLTNKASWFIYLGKQRDLDEARSSRDKYRKTKMFKDAWLLTVHE